MAVKRMSDSADFYKRDFYSELDLRGRSPLVNPVPLSYTFE